MQTKLCNKDKAKQDTGNTRSTANILNKQELELRTPTKRPKKYNWTQYILYNTWRQ